MAKQAVNTPRQVAKVLVFMVPPKITHILELTHR
jgi:hypothetical protein